MNLYKILHQNRHDPIMVKRHRLSSEISGKPFIDENQLTAILRSEGLEVPKDFGYNLVTETTRKAFSAASLGDKINTLRKLHGIGFVAATAVLSYSNPFKYAKADERVYNQLNRNFSFKLPERDSKSEFNIREYQAYINALKALADHHGMKLPDAEYVLLLMDQGKAQVE